MTDIPQKMRAFVAQAPDTATVQEVPVPQIGDNDILVRVVALAQNPTDWKGVMLRNKPGSIVGCDWSGYVVKTGKNVQNHAVGDFVTGFVQGSNWADRGAFAEYVKTEGRLAWKVPDNTLSPEEAATLGCAFWTAAQALFNPTRLGLVEPPNKVAKEEWVFVYGGSSSVGMFTIQLAHLAGYKVATVASPRNFDLCKSLGADVVFDYKDPDAIRKIKNATNDSIHAAVETIGVLERQQFSIVALGTGPGKVVTILPPLEEAAKLRDDVELQHTIVYTACGLEFSYGGKVYSVSHDDAAHMAQFLEKVPELVRTGKIKPNPTKKVEGGLDGIHDGFKYMLEGKNSGQKIVYRLSD